MPVHMGCSLQAALGAGSSMVTGSPVLSLSPSHGGLLRAPKGLNPSKWALLSSAGRAPRGRRKGNWHDHIPEDNYTLYQPNLFLSQFHTREHLQFGEEITAFHTLTRGWRGCSKVGTTLAWDLLLSRSLTGKPQTTPTKS